MKASRGIPIALFFSTCLVLGFLAGSTLGRMDKKGAEAYQPVASPAIAVDQAPKSGANGQLNFLVIGVDSLQSGSPRLESMWLLLYMPDTPHLTLVPLYPAPAESASGLAAVINASYHLEPEGIPSPSFLQALKDRDLWWSSFIVVDEIGISELVDIVGGITINQVRYNGVHAVASVPQPWDNPQAALQAQIAVIEGFCKNKATFSSFANSENILDTLSHHIVTDLSTSHVRTIGQSLAEHNQPIMCEFPTMAGSTAQALVH